MAYEVYHSPRDASYYFACSNIFGTLEDLLDEKGKPVMITCLDMRRDPNKIRRIVHALDRMPA